METSFAKISWLLILKRKKVINRKRPMQQIQEHSVIISALWWYWSFISVNSSAPRMNIHMSYFEIINVLQITSIIQCCVCWYIYIHIFFLGRLYTVFFSIIYIICSHIIPMPAYGYMLYRSRSFIRILCCVAILYTV